MGLEAATYINDLVTTNPVGGSDPKAQGDDHIRLIKAVLKNSFPGITGAVNFGGWHLKTDAFASKSSNYSLLAADDGKFLFFDTATAGVGLTLTLLAASTAGDGLFAFVLKDSADYLLTVTPSGSELLNGANSSIQLGPNEALLLWGTGSAWRAVHIRTDLPGTVKFCAAVASEIGWLDCDGSAISRTTYARLFSAITIVQNGTTSSGLAIITGLSDTSKMAVGMPVSGAGVQSESVILTVDSASQITLDKTATASATVAICVAPFGVGDGSTTFNVPAGRGRAAIGTGTGSGLTARRLGVAVGAETHQLTVSELPAHTHTIAYNQDSVDGGGSENRLESGGSTATSSVGSDAAHNNMQPSLGLRMRVKI